jgi:4-hydroxy-3-polyprenylbenzoate decarboxylase
MDTLDYSGSGLNQGSKLVVAAVGEKRRSLPASFEGTLRDGYRNPRVVMPGVLAVEGTDPEGFRASDAVAKFPLVILCDDAEFTARSLANFLWVTFTRSNPAVDVHGIDAFYKDKAWGCRGSIVIDARIKPHHAPPLVMDKRVTDRVDALAARGGPLHGLF